MGQFSIWHLLLILIVVLVFFGPSRLPGLGNSLGKAIRGFKEGIKGLEDEEDEIAEREARQSHDPLPPGTKRAAKKTKKTDGTPS